MFENLRNAQPIAHAILVLASVSVLGLSLGSLKYRGIGLGMAGVLFAGILFGHFGQRIDHTILEFAKEFGLVLFVFTIGLQLGPGFIDALRRQGLQLNLLAASIVALGAIVAVIGASIFGIDYAAVLGLFSGATTNTPSLGAAQLTLVSLPGISADRAELPALAYAVAYPAGIVGIIGSLLLLRTIFRIDAVGEAEQFVRDQRRGIEPLERMNLLIENRALDGLPLCQIPGQRETGIIISRTRQAGSSEIKAAADDTALHIGDQLLAVGTHGGLEQFAHVVGRPVTDDLMQAGDRIVSRRIVVTRKEVVGKTLLQLGLDHLYGVALTRIARGDLEMTAVPDLRLRFGDVVQVVGGPEQIARASDSLGNSVKAMNETQFIPFFVGIALGVLAGIIPISLPGLPVPLRLGLAGGPLIIGIALSRLGNIGKLVWHVPHNANVAFRELGITLFLAAVGLTAGERFFATVLSRAGLLWLAGALIIAVVPLLIVGSFARAVLKLNYTTITGLIAGSTTDPPALSFASLLAKSDGPQVAYATVYPITMLLRILCAQALTLWLCR